MTEHERYLFDLRGYLVVENALSPEEVQAANAALDQHWDQVKPRARESSLSGGSEALRGEKGRLEAGLQLFHLEPMKGYGNTERPQHFAGLRFGIPAVYLSKPRLQLRSPEAVLL